MGTKRAAAEDSGSAKVAKAAKTEKNANGAKNTAKKEKAPPPPSNEEFKASALPLHVSFTHTPPSIEKEGEGDDAGKEGSSSSADAGYIGNLTLVPSTFSTGSYGWKGSKRIAVELQGEDGKKQTVHVMISINATVAGSKPTKAAKAKKGKKAKEEEEDEEEEAGEEDDE